MNPEFFMRRALDLARLGSGRTSPNPMVGCVIEHNGLVIGEGWHRQAGQAHAEVTAFNSVVHTQLLPESNVYVTLEPCSHFGKTPPCSNLIVSKNVSKLFVGSVDPNPLVAGRGIKQIENSGIKVISGLLTKECQNLNSRFFTYHQKKRPYIVLKWAQSADFYLDPRKSKTTEGQFQVSSPESGVLTHKWRSDEDAILVGANTIRIDNPALNVRKWTGSNPVRIVIDKNLNLKNAFYRYTIFTDKQPTIVVNEKMNSIESYTEYLKLDFNSLLPDLITELYKREIQSILVEGGAFTLQKFINNKLWDEARIYTSNEKFNGGLAAPKIQYDSKEKQTIGKDSLTVLKP